MILIYGLPVWFPSPLVLYAEWIFFFVIGQNILFSFRLLIPRGLQATGKPEPGNYRNLLKSTMVHLLHVVGAILDYSSLLALPSFMPTYQHGGRLFGGFDTSVVQIDGVLSRQSTLAYAALHHIILPTLATAYHSPHKRLHTTPHAPPATVHARRQLRPMLPLQLDRDHVPFWLVIRSARA